MANLKKLPRLSEIDDKDSVKAQHKEEYIDGAKFAKNVLEEAQACWDDLLEFRKSRERCKRYTYGNQWGDLVMDEGGHWVTEEEYIRRQGNVPLKNNLINRLVKTVNGVWRNQNQEPTCQAIDRDEQGYGETMTIALQSNWRKNRLTNVYGRLLNELLISGVCCSKEAIEWKNGIKDCFTYTPQVNYIFFNGGISDYRMWDLTMIGEIHDLQFNDLCEKFASTPAEYKHLKEVYGRLAKESMVMRYDDTLRDDIMHRDLSDFLYPTDVTKSRVIEVWTKERKPRLHVTDPLHGEMYDVEVSEKDKLDKENAKRKAMAKQQGITEDEVPLITYEWFIDSYWYFRFLTPLGEVLREGESPFAHREHPYTLGVYPMIDGEAHSFVSDVIDQQKYVNRLITLNDWVIRASAKGVTMFPDDAIPDNMTIEDVRSEMTKPNGFMLYHPGKSGMRPEQLSNRNNNIGMSEMLTLQISLMEDISGVTGALQGKQEYSGVSGNLFQQQQQTASNSLLDILETFSQFIHDGVLKKVYNIQKCYDTKRVISIVGRKNAVTYNPDTMSDIEFDLNIVEMPSTAIYRAAANDWLMQLLQIGQINIRQLLEVGSFPFSDKLLQALDEQQQQSQAQGRPQPLQVPQDVQSQMAQNTNQQSVQQANTDLHA